MVKEIRCINAGFEDCEFLLHTYDDDELVEFTRRHAERVHGTSASREHIELIAVDVEPE